MPLLSRRLTDTTARAAPLPAAGYVIHWCPKTPGFGLRVSAAGDRAYIAERRVDGKTVRRTLGKATGAKTISAEAARALQLTVSSELQTGLDRAEVKREQRKVEKRDAVSLASALQAYVRGKRRGKDGLALKDRTKADYLAMIEPGGTKQSGEPFADGMLFCLAEKSIHKISADDMRAVHNTARARSQRQATYAMQVLRAVLNWHGVTVPDSPLSKTTAGMDRIVLAGTAGKPRPIPPERLGAWWRAAAARAGNAAADGCRFILLTGCRPGEVFGSDHEPGLLVQDLDLEAARAVLKDTKNRRDHTIVLSAQALAIAREHCGGKAAGAKVFDVRDPRFALNAINAEAGVDGITPHKLRHTFASVAEELVSGYALKRMLNHTESGDVTGAHYVGKSESQLRLSWQIVADFIEERANGNKVN
jgi:integrase